MALTPRIVAAIKAGYRLHCYFAETDERTPEPGPYRIRIFRVPIGESNGAVASGPTFEAAVADLDRGLAGDLLHILSKPLLAGPTVLGKDLS